MNNDTRPDIVVVNCDTNDVSILLGYGDGTFQDQIMYSTGSCPQSVAIEDFNDDSRLDIVVANGASGNISVFLGYGNGTFQSQITYSAGSALMSIAVGDFNKDIRLDTVVANHYSDTVSILLGSVNTIFIKKMTVAGDNDSQPEALVIKDLNNDGNMDIAVANSVTNNIGIFLGYGNISFSTETTYSTGAYSFPRSLAVGDFDQDTYLDIVVANYDSINVGILLGYGNGSFGNQTTYPTGFYPHCVAVGDFDNDGMSDIIVAVYGASSVLVLFGYHSGTFADRVLIQLEFGSHPFSVLVGDFNNDRKFDFTVANSGTDSLQIYLQTC